MNINSDAWREVEAYANNEIKKLKDLLAKRQPLSEAEFKWAKIIAWEEILKLGKETKLEPSDPFGIGTQ